jgi:serine/threonine protein kinase
LGFLNKKRNINKDYSSLKNGKGTLNYMAPELFLERPKFGFKSDIYSFGVLIFEIIEGVPPFDNDNDETIIIKKIQKITPHLTKKIPDQLLILKKIMDLCLVIELEDRPSIDDIIELLKN